jgi:alpha-beta hydrolase superfamily lysophospholipase
MAERNIFTLPARDGLPLFVYRWLPAGAPRAVIQVAHGMSEHAGRYDALAQTLNSAGLAVYAQDHRGHGRTAAAPNDLGYLGQGIGWRTVLEDIGLVQHRIAADFPGLPIILLGHSMGAFLAQQFAGERGGTLRGLVLAGTYREARWLALAGGWLARLERWRLGPRGHSRLIRALTFDTFNRRFAPNRTAADWLSRDESEVDRYVADPHCGFAASIQLWIELLDALALGLPLPPAELPVCVLVGDQDSVAGPDPSAKKLAALFRQAGTHVTHHVYPEARHELFHETNRDEVTRDLVIWLNKVL